MIITFIVSTTIGLNGLVLPAGSGNLFVCFSPSLLLFLSLFFSENKNERTKEIGLLFSEVNLLFPLHSSAMNANSCTGKRCQRRRRRHR